MGAELKGLNCCRKRIQVAGDEARGERGRNHRPFIVSPDRRRCCMLPHPSFTSRSTGEHPERTECAWEAGEQALKRERQRPLRLSAPAPCGPVSWPIDLLIVMCASHVQGILNASAVYSTSPTVKIDANALQGGTRSCGGGRQPEERHGMGSCHGGVICKLASCLRHHAHGIRRGFAGFDSNAWRTSCALEASTSTSPPCRHCCPHALIAPSAHGLSLQCPGHPRRPFQASGGCGLRSSREGSCRLSCTLSAWRCYFPLGHRQSPKQSTAAALLLTAWCAASAAGGGAAATARCPCAVVMQCLHGRARLTGAPRFFGWDCRACLTCCSCPAVC